MTDELREIEERHLDYMLPHEDNPERLLIGAAADIESLLRMVRERDERWERLEALLEGK